ncbi:Rha family transcriptional regulator [Escherichia coli]
MRFYRRPYIPKVVIKTRLNFARKKNLPAPVDRPVLGDGLFTRASEKSEWRISSRLVADMLGVEHDNIVQTIKEHKEELQTFGTLRQCTYIDQMRTVINSVLNRDEKSKRGGSLPKHYPLNVEQFDCLMRYVRGADAARTNKLKVDVTRAMSVIHRQQGLRDAQLVGYWEVRDLLKDSATSAEEQHIASLKLAAMENSFAGISRGERADCLPETLGKLTAAHNIELAIMRKRLSEGATLNQAIHDAAELMRSLRTYL